jgi:hypothetical protein
MARTHTDRMPSSYYPPRARWYSRFFYPCFAVHRALHLEKIHLPSGLSPAQFLLSLIGPGFSFCALGRRIEGVLFLSAYGLGGVVFVVWLGYPAASVAYGLMVASHAISLIYLELRWRPRDAPSLKLAFAVATLLAVGLAVYRPLLGFIERHLLLPVRTTQGVVVVLRTADLESSRPGDWAVCRVKESGAVGFWLESGFTIGPVLARAGDRVRFGTNSFSVNGVEQPSRRNMPVSGELTVPENRWFVWPDLAIRGQANAAAVNEVLIRAALVSRDEFVGRPLKRWFWRRQELEML